MPEQKSTVSGQAPEGSLMKEENHPGNTVLNVGDAELHRPRKALVYKVWLIDFSPTSQTEQRVRE
jgi:hypothetical protein